MEHKKMIAPSLMCVDLMNVEASIRELEKADTDFLHIDIMDNHFVPNITLCPDFIRQLKKITQMPLDVHLMIENPQDFLHQYTCLGPKDFLVVHVESEMHIQRSLAAIKKMGVRPGLALNPATPLNSLDYLLDDVEMILLMTVNPGFAGQQLLPATLDKISELEGYLQKRGKRRDILIEVDGNVSFENTKKMLKKGADVFVGGSSSVFSKGKTVEENCRIMRDILSGKEAME